RSVQTARPWRGRGGVHSRGGGARALIRIGAARRVRGRGGVVGDAATRVHRRRGDHRNRCPWATPLSYGPSRRRRAGQPGAVGLGTRPPPVSVTADAHDPRRRLAASYADAAPHRSLPRLSHLDSVAAILISNIRTRQFALICSTAHRPPPTAHRRHYEQTRLHFDHAGRAGWNGA